MQTSFLKALRVTFLLPLMLATVIASGNVESQSTGSDNSDAVHWAWGIPDDQWHGELKTLVLALANNELQPATELLTEWLDVNADEALLSLPLLEQFFFDNPDHDLAFVYVESLNALSLSERMYQLALLNFGNLAVAEVGHATLVQAWKNAPQDVADWLDDTPSFTDYSVLDKFAAWLKTDGEADALAKVVFPLSSDNLKKSRYLQDGITHWVRTEPDAAIAHFDGVAATLTTEATQWDASFAMIATTIAEQQARQGKLENALDWVLRIINPFDADNAKFYVAQAITTSEDAAFMSQWLEKHVVAEDYLLDDINTYLSTLTE